MFISEQTADDLVEAMARLHCRDVRSGSYQCYESTKYGFDVDGCLVGEINKLNANGITTIGCCCGHGNNQSYIQVSPEFCDTMQSNGYEQLPLDEFANGKWCFIPKTKLPQIIKEGKDE